MYKVGDKVELDHELWTVKGIDGDMLQIENETGSRIVSACEVKRQSAHDKLLALGYEFNKRNDYVIYTHDELSRVTIYRDKTYSCGDANLTLSRILTQYLEELEAKE